MVEVISQAGRKQVAESQKQVSKQQQRLATQRSQIGRQQQRLTSAQVVRGLSREKRQLATRPLSAASKKIQTQTSQLLKTSKELTRLSKLPTREEVIFQAKERARADLKVARAALRDKGIAIAALPKRIRSLVQKAREGQTDRAIIKRVEAKLNRSLSAVDRATVLLLAKGVTPEEIIAKQSLISSAASPSDLFTGTPQIPAISKTSIPRGIVSGLSKFGIRPDIDKIDKNIQALGGLIFGGKQPPRITTIPKHIPAPGTGGRGTTGTTFRIPTLEDVGTGVLPNFQEAELKAQDVFRRFKLGNIDEAKVEKELAKIEKDFHFKESLRTAPRILAGGAALGAIPLVGPVLGGAFIGSGIKHRKEVLSFAKMNPAAAGISFTAGLLGGGIGSAGRAGFTSARASAKFAKVQPKIKLLSGKSKQTAEQILIEQLDGDFSILKTQPIKFEGAKNYEVTVPTSEGILKVTILEFERNGVKSFFGTQEVNGVITPVLIRGQSIVQGSDGLAKIITRVAKLSQKDQPSTIVLGKKSPTKFRLELRELIEEVKLIRSKKFKEDLFGNKVTSKEISFLESQVREPLKGGIRAKKGSDPFTDKIVKAAILKGISPELAEKFALSSIFSKTEIIRLLKKPFTKAEFDRAIKTGDSRFLLGRKLTDVTILGEKTIGGNAKISKLKVVKTFFEKGKSVPKGKRKIRISGEDFDVTVPLVRMASAKKFRGTGPPIIKKPFKSLSKVKIKPLIRVVPKVEILARRYVKQRIKMKKKIIEIEEIFAKEKLAETLKIDLHRKASMRKTRIIKLRKDIGKLVDKVEQSDIGLSLRPSSLKLILKSPKVKAKFKAKKLLKDKQLPSAIGTFAQIAKQSAKGIEKQAFKSQVITGVKTDLLGVGIPRAVGGLGREIAVIPSVGLTRPKITVQEPQILSLAKTISDVKISPITITNIKLDANQGVLPLLASISKLNIFQKNQIKLGQRFSTTELSALGLNSQEKLRVSLASRLVQRQQQQQRQRQRQTQIQQQIARPTRPIKPRLRLRPILGDEPIKTIPIGTPKKGTKGYNAFVKQKKKFFKVNKVPLEKKKARDLASFVTDKTLSATWKITRTNKKAKKPVIIIPTNYYKRNQNKFRGFKKVKGRKVTLLNSAIEKRGSRLDSRTEVKRIQAARFVKRLSKRLVKVKPLIKIRRKR